MKLIPFLHTDKSLKCRAFLYYMLLFVILVPSVFADTATDLQAKIDDRNNQIKQLETQIQQYNQQVDQVGKEANTLQNNIKTLDLTHKKLTTDLTLTQNKIIKTTLTIEQLNGGIATTTTHIDVNKKAIASILKSNQQLEDAGIFEMLLSSKSVEDVWNDIDMCIAAVKKNKKYATLIKNDSEKYYNELEKLGVTVFNINYYN